EICTTSVQRHASFLACSTSRSPTFSRSASRKATRAPPSRPMLPPVARPKVALGNVEPWEPSWIITALLNTSPRARGTRHQMWKSPADSRRHGRAKRANNICCPR
ncbi:unnamed protein product, partial [Ectocarpus sp. 6 AP-2014]